MRPKKARPPSCSRACGDARRQGRPASSAKPLRSSRSKRSAGRSPLVPSRRTLASTGLDKPVPYGHTFEERTRSPFAARHCGDVRWRDDHPHPHPPSPSPVAAPFRYSSFLPRVLACSRPRLRGHRGRWRCMVADLEEVVVNDVCHVAILIFRVEIVKNVRRN